jgi:hypothetical protein
MKPTRAPYALYPMRVVCGLTLAGLALVLVLGAGAGRDRRSEGVQRVVAVDSIAGFRVAGTTVAQATRAFAALGAPLHATWVEPDCLLSSNVVGITFVYETFGLSEGQRRRACATGDTETLFFDATATESSWHTNLGLRVGDSVGKLRRLYPKATALKLRNANQVSWFLSFKQLGPHSGLSLIAKVSSGRVVALQVQFGGH